MSLQRSLKVIQTGTIRKLGSGFLFAFDSNYGVSLTVYGIFSVKELRDLESGSRGRSRSLKMAPFDKSYTTFYWSSIVSIAVCCAILKLFEVE